MPEADSLYQEVILDHNRKPRNRRQMEHPTHYAGGHNPLCGDRVAVFLKVEDGKIADVCFDGKGCAICTASSSIMTQTMLGKSQREADELAEAFNQLITGKGNADDLQKLGKARVFGGIAQFPVRVKCASLAWRTLQAALKGNKDEVQTE